MAHRVRVCSRPRAVRKAHSALESMQASQILPTALTVLATIASGLLECSTIPMTPAQEHGAELYGRMCAVCHGRGGEGYKADQAPALRHRELLGSATDGFLREAILRGRAGTTMSAWGAAQGGPLSVDDVADVIALIRRWEHWPKPKLDERRLAGDPSRGSNRFAKECARCHGARGMGGPNVSI